LSDHLNQTRTVTKSQGKSVWSYSAVDYLRQRDKQNEDDWNRKRCLPKLNAETLLSKKNCSSTSQKGCRTFWAANQNTTGGYSKTDRNQIKNRI